MAQLGTREARAPLHVVRCTQSTFCTGLQSSKDLKREAGNTAWMAARNQPFLSEGKVNLWPIPTFGGFFLSHTSTKCIYSSMVVLEISSSYSPGRLQTRSTLQTAAYDGNTVQVIPTLELGQLRPWWRTLWEALLSSDNLSRVLWSPSQPSPNIKYTGKSDKGTNSCYWVLPKTTYPWHKRAGVGPWFNS